RKGELKMNTNMNTIVALEGVTAPVEILKSVLEDLGNGRISEAVDPFDDQFEFIDQALGLEFTEKARLSEFFQKSRELFPDTTVKVVSTFECGDHVIAEWMITATQTAPYLGLPARLTISFAGVSIVRVENGKITRWTDYYDKGTSWRMSLAAFFA